MTAPFSIRLYEAADRDPCADLFERVMHETFPDDDPAIYAAGTFARHTAGEKIWLAHAGGATIGLASLWTARPFLHFLLVLPSWRRRGVGSSLMRVALLETEGPVDLKCRLGNAAAHAFYQAHGWREVGRSLDDAEPHIRFRLRGSPQHRPKKA